MGEGGGEGGEAAECALGHIVGEGISGLHHGFWCKIFVTIRIYLFYMRTENPRVGSSILSLGTRESKGLQRKLQAFFRYGLLPDAHLRQPPGGASIGRAFPLFFLLLLLLSPPFPSSCLCPVRGTVPGVTGGFLIPIRAFIRTGCAPEQHAACRISG